MLALKSGLTHTTGRARVILTQQLWKRSLYSAPAVFTRSDVFSFTDTFSRRHIGPNAEEAASMLKTVKCNTMEDLLQTTIPSNIRVSKPIALGEGITETEMLTKLKEMVSKNKVYSSFIGMGYANTITPPVILRNILENPGWYTQYTPYQAEISQGRLESLLNFQTMVSDLTGLPIANASLLDEGTAAGEAMAVCYSHLKEKRKVFFVDHLCHPQTIACVKTRAEGFGITVVEGSFQDFQFDLYKDNLMGVLVQYPATDGQILDFSDFFNKVHQVGAKVVCATDLLALTLLTPPGEFGADICVGNSQRFGVPLGFGGPHAAFFSCKEELKRRVPGRIIGVSKDAQGKKAYRLALQTREQHVRRDKATSNICTAQALLANMAAMYAVYHGPKGLQRIANRVNNLTAILAQGISQLGHTVKFNNYFDTITVQLTFSADQLISSAEELRINVRRVDHSTISISLDEATTKEHLQKLLRAFAAASPTTRYTMSYSGEASMLDIPNLDSISTSLSLSSEKTFLKGIPEKLLRKSPYLEHPVFNKYHSETDMLRYIHHLQSKDISLVHSMIPLGSCTMKLNATAEMIPISWPEISNIHPFVPPNQAKGYQHMLEDLCYALGEVLGFDAVSLQPNSGAQGEYAGLRVIKAYHQSRGDYGRKVCLIPVSAHGTNPASAVMAGLKVVPVKCTSTGTLNMEDLKEKATKYSEQLACIMITYPSTFGVFENNIQDICDIIHDNGGQVYLDGANLNAQVALCRPGDYGADVCHLNLHKTFAIPHGGGGPGMGPIGVKKHLSPFLPGHPVSDTAIGGVQLDPNHVGPVSAAPFGSASILAITWAYMKMLGLSGLQQATKLALLNANYMMERLSPHYKILYTNENHRCAHEFVLDIRPFEKSCGIMAVDVAKRLQDYGFHSPTMSFPVSNTIMIEPTESESKEELDRFCNAMIQIRQEIKWIENQLENRPKDVTIEDCSLFKRNILKNAPHPLYMLLGDSWSEYYTREEAAFPLAYLKGKKVWPTVSRVDDMYGDLHLICNCPQVEDFEEDPSNLEATSIDKQEKVCTL